MKFVVKQSLAVSALIALVLIASYFVHTHFVASLKLGSVALPLLYLANFGLASATASAIIWCIKFKSEIAGFVFMGGSLLKFAVFFIFFFPKLSDSPPVRKAQIIAFYIPYAICLIIEVWFLIRQMNRTNS